MYGVPNKKVMRPVPSREHTSSAIPFRIERAIVMLTLEWNWLIMKAVQRWACCCAHAREWTGWIGWRRAARVGTARVSLHQRNPLARQQDFLQLSSHSTRRTTFSRTRAKTERRFLLSARSDASSLSCRGFMWTHYCWPMGHRGSLSVWGARREEDLPCLQGTNHFGEETEQIVAVLSEKLSSSRRGAGSKRLSYLTGNTDCVARDWDRVWINTCLRGP